MVRTMKVNGYSFAYVENGIGVPVVFVHGSVSDYRTWNHQLEYFSDSYCTIAYSRRFHWPNRPISSDEDYAMEQHVTDLRQVLQNIGEPVHLIGHSYGAFVALLLAMQSAEMIRSLILAEPPVITLFVSSDPKPMEILKLVISRPQVALVLIKFAARGLQPAIRAVRNENVEKAIEVFGKATLGPEAYSSLSEARKNQVKDNFIAAEFLGSGFPPLDEHQIREIHKPVLLLSGEDSPSVFRVLLHRLEKLLPDIEYQQIPNASHICHEDNPTAYNERVRSFIARQD